MAANAPYYQMRGQFSSAANTQFVPVDDDEYDLSTAVTPHEAALFTDRQPSETPVNTLEENHNFVELLEAATTAAAGQAAQALGSGSAGTGMMNSGRGKRKRVSSPLVNETSISHERTDAGSGSKRARMHILTDPHLHDAEDDERGIPESRSLISTSETLLNDARAAGVHSAAVLFRRSSEKSSRKYTRPPMSKLFMSLQLTPENFLHLQAQAKSYMLDSAYPDRQSCVGNRGKGDTDMVKLRLFNCVRDFLAAGAGKQFFGENVEKPGEKDAMEAARALGEEKVPTEGRLLWPRDGNKIISLVTPLLRRMVTNERQRMYAIETRKGGAKKKEPSVEAATLDDAGHGINEPHHTGQQVEQLQPSFNLPHLHPLAPVQTQNQHLYVASPASSILPLPSNTARTISPELPMTSPKYGESHEPSIELFAGKKLDLPSKPDPEPILQHINIFLAKTKVLLKCEKRLINKTDAPLFHMTFLDLRTYVEELIKKAMLLYPALDPKSENSTGMGPEALRGLAVAATEIQNDSAAPGANTEVIAHSDSITSATLTRSLALDMHASPQSLTPSSHQPSTTKETPNSFQPPSSILSVTPLPSYEMGMQSSLGWKEIKSLDDWHRAKLDVAFALWADKVLNVVVTLL